MYARWESKESCLEEMRRFHSEEDAAKIVEDIDRRVSSGMLYKSADSPMMIMKAGEEIVVYGPCSWEKRDPVGDLVTTKFMVNFFDKWFHNVPEEYRNIMIDHGNYKVGKPLLKWTSPGGETYYTHVHEKAPMLLAIIRPDDGLSTTKHWRNQILSGSYKSYSISWVPTKYNASGEANDMTVTHEEGDPVECTICREGMVDSAKFTRVKDLNSNSGANQTPPNREKDINLDSNAVSEVKVPLDTRLKLNRLFTKALENVEQSKKGTKAR